MFNSTRDPLHIIQSINWLYLNDNETSGIPIISLDLLLLLNDSIIIVLNKTTSNDKDEYTNLP